MERETFVGIDVGTTKVVALIGEVGRDGALTIIGKGIVPASGLRKGIVVNIDQTVHSISAAIEKAERHAGYKIERAFVGVGGQHVEGLVDALLDSPEYLENFGVDTVPFQRSRVLAGHARAALPFNQKAPRYNAYWRDASARRAPASPFAGGGAQFSGGQMSAAWVGGQPPKLAQTIWLAVAAIGGLELVRLVITTAGSMLSTGSAG